MESEHLKVGSNEREGFVHAVIHDGRIGKPRHQRVQACDDVRAGQDPLSGKLLNERDHHKVKGHDVAKRSGLVRWGRHGF